MNRLPTFKKTARILFAFLVSFSAAFAELDRNLQTTPLMRLEAQALVSMLSEIHYNRDGVKSADYPQLVSDFMEQLDPQHLFFTAEDAATLKAMYGPRLETDLALLGNIDAAFDVFRVYEKRIRERTTWVFGKLGDEYDFTKDESYTPDRTKSAWPGAGAEADELWRRRVKYELIQEMLGGKKTVADARDTVRKRYERMVKNIDDLESSDIEEMYLTCLTKMYDPHSSFFSADTLEDFSIQMKLSLIGIGAVLGLDDEGYCVVREVVPGGPADLSGQIKTNDKIVAVQQNGGENVEIIGMKLRRIVDMIRGKKDTRVTLTILPHDAIDSTKTKEVLITRDLIKLNSARASAAIYDVPTSDDKTTPVGVITLNSFYGPAEDPTDADSRSTASKDVAELVGKLKKSGITALVIDLRRNGGGLLSEAIDMTGLFIQDGPVVQVRDYAGHLAVDRDLDSSIAYDGPLVILTSRYSASASEIFAGALQNYGRAVIVGDSSTHGKGTVQAVLEMKNYLSSRVTDVSRAGAAKLTIQKFYLPNGSSTQKKGVVPDIPLPSIDDFLPIGESDLPHALVWDEIKTTRFAGKPLSNTFVEPLLQASLQRQQNLEEFSYLKKGIDWFKLHQDRKEVSLNLATREAEKAANDAFKKEQDSERDKLALTNYPKREVKLDSVIAAEASGSKDAVASVEEGDPDNPDDKAEDFFDVHLREALRVVTDAIRLSSDQRYWADGRAPITAARISSNKS